MKTIEIMKKIVLTILTIVGLMHVSHAQSVATVVNNSDCDFQIAFSFGDTPDCDPIGTPSTLLVAKGSTMGVAIPGGAFYIKSALINRVIINKLGVVTSTCTPNFTIAPPPTCGSCITSLPQSFTTPFDGDCCSDIVTGTWTENSCVGNNQTTTLTLN
tara:strand:+ start:110 stop:583 length:474 start_codon:yes stop_codon:yes gene_type:complete